MSNALIHEASPYLRQHAENPVAWRAWTPAVFDEARRLDKPVLLSIGYSTCHWCHVMAAESFEDVRTAAVMNDLYINVKVDREERPDLDHIYQEAHAVLTGRHGGWPLTMFLAPDQTPFFGGTYFPDVARYGLPAFRDLLEQVADAYRRHAGEIRRQNHSLRAMLADGQPRGTLRKLDARPLQIALRALEQSFDPVEGGFGMAPKFPKPTDLAFCLRRKEGEAGVDKALAMAHFTLRRMLAGGIRDQLDGGFFRYSVDAKWQIPHFEKMLYDNAQLLEVLGEAWRRTGDESLRDGAGALVDWLCTEMRGPEGAFYAALDADSEHREGAFYLWTPDEVAELLNADEYAVFAPSYGLDQPANFEKTHWHLNRRLESELLGQRLAVESVQVERVLSDARAKLRVARAQRPRPHCDDKRLTAWNALTAKALARAGQIFDEAGWVSVARTCLDFIERENWREDVLYAVNSGRKAYQRAYLDDHAFLLDALLVMLEVDFRRTDLEFAIRLADTLLEDFEDPDNGGFFFTAHDHEALILRPKPSADTTLPAGNAVAATALLRLGHLLGETRYLIAAERCLNTFYEQICEHPAQHASFLGALETWLTPPSIVIVRGAPQGLAAWQEVLRQLRATDVHILTIPNGVELLPPALNKPPGNPVNAWVCQGVNCLAAISKPEELRQACKAGELG